MKTKMTKESAWTQMEKKKTLHGFEQEENSMEPNGEEEEDSIPFK
jgi:hypothetical protein